MSMSTQAIGSLFGKVRMGYLVAESNKRDEWLRFAVEGLGLHADLVESETLALRVDHHQRRIIIKKGPAEDVVALGWQLTSQFALDLALLRLKQRGATVTCSNAEEASSRGVDRFWRVMGPKGLALELYTEPRFSIEPLRMKASGFITGDAGMGHVAITTRNPKAMQTFWQEVFDARVSDHIEDRIDGINLDFTFLRINERHHSIATASTRGVRLDPLRTRIHHMNLQTASLEDVTQAYLRCRSMGCKIANSIGQHPNDKEVSFYVTTPSDFEIELGWNPIVVQEDNWQPTVYQGISLWGHRPENLTMGYKIGRLRNGITSLVRIEYTI